MVAKASAVMPGPLFVTVRCKAQLVADQREMVWSRQPEARKLPVGEKAREVTELEAVARLLDPWFRVARMPQELALNTKIFLIRLVSSPAIASLEPSGEKATLRPTP